MSITSPADSRSHAVSPESIMGAIVGGSVFPARNRRAKCKSWTELALFRTEQAVPGVAEPGHDVALLVEPLVDARGVDRDVGVLGVEHPDALGAGEQADELD